MACLRPLKMWWNGDYTANGKKKYVFKPPDGAFGILPAVEVPCGQCIQCRLSRARDTAIRCVHEARFYEANCFLTLTVNDDHLDKIFPGGSLCHRPFQLFMKRLRKRFEGVTEIVHPRTGKKVRPIRCVMCGEYGELLKRPHYHVLLFNFDFPDKKLFSKRGDTRLYISKILEELWPYGFATIGDVTFDSAAYVSKYVTKKVTGSMADEHYFNVETGEVLKPEYIKFPQGFGLGRLFYDKYKDQLYTHDFVRTGEKDFKMKPPKYYDKLFDVDDPVRLSYLKKERLHNASKNRLTDEQKIVLERIIYDRLEFYSKRKI